MKNFVIGYIILLAAGCAPQKTTETATKPVDSIPQQTTPINEEATTVKTDSTTVTLPVTTEETTTPIPTCIQKLIATFSAEEVQNPPRKIYSGIYKGATVYYVPAICCDFFSDVYDAKCNLLGHPDGGFTGRGDGKMPNFGKEMLNRKLIWEDKRK